MLKAKQDKIVCFHSSSEAGDRTKRKFLKLAVALLAIAMLATPVMAIGPKNTVGKNPHVVIHGFNTQMWLPSGVMNEWIENPTSPSPIAATVEDQLNSKSKLHLPLTIPQWLEWFL